MPDSTQTPVKPKPAVGKSKEVEPQVEEDRLMSEIIRTSEAADETAEKQVKEQLADARLSRPEPKIPPDLADSGVKSPQAEAERVIREGPTIEFAISEGEYKRGLHQKVGGWVANNVIVGVSSFAGLVTWVGRMIKLAHKHTMKVIFRKEG